MLINNIHSNELAASVQNVKARVELYNGSTLEKICNCGDVLSGFTIDRTGEGKFFGFGICQKLQASLIDGDKEINLTPNHTIEVSYGVGSNYIYPFPKFYIEELSRDVDTNDLTITAFDSLYKASTHTVKELELPESYTIRTFVTACAALLGLPIDTTSIADSSFSTLYEQGANFSGDENIRSALNAAAEVTQTIYYIDSNWELTFKRLDASGNPVLTIEKTEFFDFINNGAITLANISHVTELGDNLTPLSTLDGVTQYVRDNPFWELRNDTHELLDAAKARICGTSISQFELDWFGNYLLEIGDKIRLVTKEDEELFTYVMDDTIYFDGSFGQRIRWHYDENSAESESNPTTIGAALNQTSARVDKANKQITLLVRDAATTGSELETIKENQTTFTQTANDITLRVESNETNGTTKVDTGTGFTFDEEGLRINKDNSGIENLLDNTGMYVKQDGTEVLSANEEGVKAKDLHAVTYLWIGSHSRFEDYEGGRTGCFWIGK